MGVLFSCEESEFDVFKKMNKTKMFFVKQSMLSKVSQTPKDKGLIKYLMTFKCRISF